MDTLGDMRAFVRVVEAGGITAAATQLGLAKSAVSRRIRSLETSAGTELFRRRAHQLELTEAGLLLYRRSVQVIQDVEEAFAQAGDAHSNLAGTIRLGAPVSFGAMYMADPLAEFSTRHPAIRFEINLDDKRVDLMEQNLDVALRVGDLTESDLKGRRLSRVRHIMCASPEYWAKHGRPVTLDDLDSHRLLRYGNHARRELLPCITPLGERVEKEVQVVAALDNGDLMRELAVRGLGVVVEPSFILRDAIRDGSLEPVLLDHLWYDAHLYAIYLPTRHMSRRVRVFIDFLVETFSDPPSWDDDLAIS